MGLFFFFIILRNVYVRIVQMGGELTFNPRLNRVKGARSVFNPLQAEARRSTKGFFSLSCCNSFCLVERRNNKRKNLSRGRGMFPVQMFGQLPPMRFIPSLLNLSHMHHMLWVKTQIAVIV